MPEVYEGNCPYIFMCYAHADRGTVLPIIRVLTDEGYRVWYDNGIQPATDFPEYIADHIHDCACFVMFVSRAFRASDWCKREVNYAIDCGNVILPVYLEDVELTRGLKLGLGTVQALFWYRRESDEVFNRRLFETRALNCCLTDEGKERRQSKNLLIQRARRLLGAGKCNREDLEGVLEDLRTLSLSLPRRDKEVEQIIHELEERIAREGEKDTPSPTTAGHAPETSDNSAIKHREEDAERHSSSTGDGEAKPTEVASASPVHPTEMKRGSGPLFATYVMTGITFGILLGEPYLNTFRKVFPSISVSTVSLVLSVVGALTGVALAFFTRERHQTADSQWTWPLLGLVLVPAGIFLVTIVVGAVVLCFAFFILLPIVLRVLLYSGDDD